MPNLRSISDLRNNADDISEICHQAREPVLITKNGAGDMVVMSIEAYERRQALLSLYAKLAEAEKEIMSGAQGEDSFEISKQLRDMVHGQL